MKKKLLCILACLCVLAFSFVGCGSSNDLNSAKFKKADVLSGSGSSIGEYGYVEISKETLKSTSQEDFKKFVDNHVSNSGLNYVSIICDDGIGICFAGSNAQFADYGQLDEDGALLKSYGTILFGGNGTYTYTAN